MKKKLAFLFIGACLLAACSAGPTGKSGGSSNGGNKQTGEDIKIGVNLELSGKVAGYGNQEKEGIELAVDQINAAGGILGKKVKLVIKDNKSDFNEAATATANLATNDQVVAMIGPATSGLSKTVLPNVNKVKVPFITPSGTDDSITVSNGKVGEYVFRASFQDSFQGKVLAKYAQEKLDSKKVAILGDNSSEYAIGLTKAFKKTYNGKVVVEESFTSGDKDFQAVLTKIKNSDFDVLYVPGYYEESGLIIKQAREMGIKQPILGADGFGDEKIVQLAGASNVTDVYYTAHFSTLAPANKTVQPFMEAFKKKFGSEPSTFNALAYDAMLMVKQAIENEKSADAASIAKGLANLKNFEGVTGNITVDKEHNPEKSAVILKYTDGKESSAETVNP